MENIQEKIEDKIIDLISFGSDGRLIVYKPENSDKDLVVERKGDYKNTPIFIKIFNKELFSPDKNLVTDNNFYLFFTQFDIVKQELKESIYIVPSKDSLGVINFDKYLVKKENVGNFFFNKLENKK